MKKMIALTALLLSLTLTACTPHGTAGDGTADEPSGTQEPHTGTQSLTEADTAPAKDIYEREDARAGLIGWSLDDVRVGGTAFLTGDGSAAEQLAARNDTVLFDLGDAHDYVTFSGWVGFDQPIDRFGYCVDGGRCVFGDFSMPAEDAVKQAGGRSASRFEITIPLFSLGAGVHTAAVVARLADGRTVRLYELRADIKAYRADPALPHDCVVDYINHAGANGADRCEGLTSASPGGDGTFARVSGVLPLSAGGILTLEGSCTLEGGIAGYAWSADGRTWFRCTDLGAPDDAHFSIGADLSALGGQTVTVYVAAVSGAQDGLLAPMVQIENVSIPVRLTDIAWSFRSDVSAQPVGADLRATDLAGVFGFGYGAGDPHVVAEDANGRYYLLGGINEMYTGTAGKYAYTVDILDQGANAMLFTRGVHACYPLDPTGIQILCGNYYETDWAGFMGGAGIWVRLVGGKLTVDVKYYDPSVLPRIGNRLFEFPVTGSRVTMADDGSTVYILVDGKLITTVTLSGAVRYDDLYTSGEAESFAASASVVTADGQTVTVQGTLVASAPSQVGMAVRPDSIAFRGVEIIPFSAFAMPEK